MTCLIGLIQRNPIRIFHLEPVWPTMLFFHLDIALEKKQNKTNTRITQVDNKWAEVSKLDITAEKKIEQKFKWRKLHSLQEALQVCEKGKKKLFSK